MSDPPDGSLIRVLLVDDHPMLRAGTRAALEATPDIEVVGSTGEGVAALHLVEALRPDVLLLDIRLPDMSGVAVAQRVRAVYPEVAILVLTGYDDSGYLRALHQLGVRGYLRKTASGEEIIAAVRAAARARPADESCSAEAPPVPLDFFEVEPLSGREQEVLRFLAAGLRNTEIADRLNLAVKTVEFHVSNVLEKLGARSRTEAVLRARQLGLITLDVDEDL